MGAFTVCSPPRLASTEYWKLCSHISARSTILDILPRIPLRTITSECYGDRAAEIYIWLHTRHAWCIKFSGVDSDMRFFLVALSVLAVALATKCPYSMDHLSRSKRSEYDIRPAVSDSSFDALIKDFGGNSAQGGWVEPLGSHQPPLRCGIPPPNCLNDTRTLHYRTIDGACNNLLYPDYGIAVSKYRRLLPPRQVLEAPNARLISLSLYGEQTRNDLYRTMASMQWGQFVAHDISQLSTQGAPKDCCSEPRNPRCDNIALPRGGPIAYHTGKTCLPFARSVSEADAICPRSRAPYPEKLTVATAYLDLSSVYGNTPAQSRNVRLFKGGLLRTSYTNGQHWLPVNRNFDGECGTKSECYSVPDKRNRFSPTIAVIQTLLVREHNRLAESLALLNADYDDERIFQEARKINIAQYQKITYYDLLPLILGRTYTHLNGLLYPVEPSEYVNDYDDSVNPAAYVEFAAVAFRYAHTQIPGWFSYVFIILIDIKILNITFFFIVWWLPIEARTKPSASATILTERRALSCWTRATTLLLCSEDWPLNCTSDPMEILIGKLSTISIARSSRNTDRI